MMLHVTFSPDERTDRSQFWIVESPLSFDEVQRAVADDHLISGKRVITKPTETKGERLIIGRTGCAFRGGGVDRVTVCDWEFIEDAA